MVLSEENNWCIKHLGSTNEEDIKLYNKIAIFFKSLKDELDKEVKKRGCYYFRHWLQDKISKKYYHRKNIAKNNPVAEKLFDFVSSDSTSLINEPACSGNTYAYPKDWKEEKELHDYFENYEYIKCDNSDKIACEKYVHYVNYIDSIYKENFERCCDEEDFFGLKCDPYFKCENMYKPGDLLNKLKIQLELISNNGGKAREDVAITEKKTTFTVIVKKIYQLMIQKIYIWILN
ncbi:variable surface protein [Plasmodium gonderi]|uniref:Variable surface protein n=1 Tax=Plasmodium gonderi TaxID=77519 RepID=A0A1Y1JPI7_PLAGO|nr:variable surface protein [Plasmodium gonderi]GAW84381.1 variable surface protein [Plasmodium gonderi]